MSIQTITRQFHGGIHPPEHKHWSSTAPLRDADLPDEVILPLTQHAGRIAEPLVQVGDRVKTGQRIAACRQGTGACIHASISGEVIAIEPRPVPHASGLTLPAVVIRSDGLDTPGFEPPGFLPPGIDWRTATAETLLPLIRQAGLVGLGGATFPTAIKVEGAVHQGVRTLIINAAECEPYITADDLLIRHHSHELLEGISILQHLLQAEQLLLGIEDNKPEALESLKNALEHHPLKDQLQICILPTRYPSGGEKQLIQLLTGLEVPSGQLPMHVGVLCHNVGTLVALHDALVLGKPLIERIVTVTGQAVQQPGNYRVRLGTPISQLLQQAQVNPQTVDRLIIGGPMMGYTLDSDAYPITKGINCLLLPTASELPLPGIEQPCIRCSRCEEVCPAQLLPQQLYFYAAHQSWDKAEEQQLFDCIECGACAWVCPSEIPLVQYYRHAKDKLLQKRAETRKADLAKLRFEARKARFEREEQEKEAKRRARAEAAARMAAAKRESERDSEKEAELANPPASPPVTTQATLTAAQPATATPAAAAGVDEKQLKQLKIAKAAATVAVKKAEKTLSNLHTSPDATPEQISEQEQRLSAAQEQLAKAEAKLAAVEESSPCP